MKWVVAGAIAIAGLFSAWILAVPAGAGLVTFDLSNCGQAGLPVNCNNSDSGRSVLDFLSGGLDLSVAGFVGATPNNFDLRLSTPDESGLGLAGQFHEEVNAGDSEVFNFGKLALLGIDSGTITLSSLQEGEVGLVTFDATGTAAVEVDGTGVSAPIPINWSLADPIVTVTALGGDVLAAADVEVSVPEPATWLLMATALFGIALGWQWLRVVRR
jgi:hypothetical protein